MTALGCGLLLAQTPDKAGGLFAAFHRAPDAITTGLGNGVLTSHSATLMFVNPAGLSYLEGSRLTLNYLNLTPSLDQRMVMFALSQHLGSTTNIGVGGMNYEVNAIPGYNREAVYTGDWAVNEWIASLVISTSAFEPFSVGVSIMLGSQTINSDAVGVAQEQAQLAWGGTYGIVYRPAKWFAVSSAVESNMLLNQTEINFPHMRHAMEAIIPYWRSKPAAILALIASADTEINHWSSATAGVKLDFPISAGLTAALFGKSAPVLVKSSATDFQLSGKAAYGCGLMTQLSGLSFNFQLAFQPDEYFNTLYFTVDIIH